MKSFPGLSAALFAGLIACAPQNAENSGGLLAIGDSVMAWNGDGAIPEVAGRALGLPVVNAAVPGARMDGGFSDALGFAVPEQYSAGAWDAVVMNGGANDLRSICGCGACDDELDALISEDGRTGLYPALLARIAEPVVLLGYYGPIDGGGGSFDGCDDELLELGARLARLADTREDVAFVTARTVIDGSPEQYAPDKVHPSALGSARIGALVADAARDVTSR